jgi:hypothetical protein
MCGQNRDIFVHTTSTGESMSISRFFRLLPEDILNREPPVYDSDEMYGLVKAVAVSILEPEESGLDLTFFQGASEYYDRVTKEIVRDQETVGMFQDLIKRLRHRYSSFVEYSKFIQSLPPIKRQSAYTDVCCCCHESLNTWKRVVRLKDTTRDPNICGHVIHYECSRRLQKNETGIYNCPLCRADLGNEISFWYDMDSTVPKF